MFIEHLTQDQLARSVTAAAVGLLGIFQLVSPRCFSCISMYFKGARAAFSPEQRARLARVLDARENAEGDNDGFSRYAGLLTLLIAPLAFFPVVPYVLPYALSCVAMAVTMFLAYLRFRRATERRVAPLVRRSPWASLPPVALAATAICLLGAATFAAYPQFRLGVIIVIVSAIALLVIAWRVAMAPAILFGDDSQLEYLVDEHVRFCRATNLVALACTPPTVLVGLAVAALPRTAHFFGTVTLVVSIAFLTVMFVSLNPLRKRISLA